MKYTIKHSCGHLWTHQLYGSAKDRDRKAAWLAGQACTECWKASQRAKAEEVTAQVNLPALSGSERQVAWANQIRAQYVANQLERIRSDPRTAEYREKMERALLRAIASVSDAGRWIDHRHNLNALISQLYEQAYKEEESNEGGSHQPTI